MDIRDFDGIFKFKLVLPALYIISWACMFLGPSFFPVVYQHICFGVLCYLCFKVLLFGFVNFRLLVGNCRILSRAEKEQNQDYVPLSDSGEEIFHAFIIPSYKEDIELIAETLAILAKQRRAKGSYLIFLAMEAHEEGSAEKAEKLIQQFHTQFRHMDFTRHVVRQYEQKGKASNVSWCAEHMEEKLQRLSIPTDSVYITCMDVDSWAPEVYYSEVEDHIKENFQKRHTFIYQPPQTFTRNNLDVPVISRVYDHMHSSLHAANLYSFAGITFPLSNYTLSFNLAKRIGFWDTVAEAIGEDFHTMQKAVWKTEGEVVGVPVYAPWNQLNLETGNGYCADLEARFWQAERHARGLNDLAYNLNMLIKERFTLRKFWMCLVILEIFALPAIVPWICLSLTFQSQVLFRFTKPSPEMISGEAFSYLFNIMTLGSFITFSCYEIVKRRSTRILYGLETESIFRVIEVALLYVPNLFIMTIPSMLVACFGSLKSNQEYRVADKVTKKRDDA